MIQNKNLFMVLFPCTYMYKGGQVKKFGHFEGSSQFHSYWQIFTLINTPLPYVSRMSEVYWEFGAMLLLINDAKNDVYKI